LETIPVSVETVSNRTTSDGNINAQRGGTMLAFKGPYGIIRIAEPNKESTREEVLGFYKLLFQIMLENIIATRKIP